MKEKVGHDADDIVADQAANRWRLVNAEDKSYSILLDQATVLVKLSLLLFPLI